MGALGVRLGSENSSGAEVTSLFCSYKCQNAFDGQETCIWIVTIQVLPPIMLFSGASLGFGCCCWILAIELQSHSQPNSLELCHLREYVRQSFLSFLLAGRALTCPCILRQKKSEDIFMANHGSARFWITCAMLDHMKLNWTRIMSIYAPTQTEAHGNPISRISWKPGMPFWHSKAAAVPCRNVCWERAWVGMWEFVQRRL